MDDTSPKISFIPKASLVREQSFLERPRPRSAIGILASIIFLATVAAYIGLYFYNTSLEKQTAASLGEIERVQKVFNASPQVGKATNFRFRAEIVQGLLNAHIAVSPVLKFLSENTLRSVMYEKFSFVKDEDGTTVKLIGEAPSYATLAYQREVLKQKTKELSSVVVSDVGLTPFGTVSFNLTLAFTPEYLSYANRLNAAQSGAASSTPLAMEALAKTLFPPALVTPGFSMPAAISSTTTGTTTSNSFTTMATSSLSGMGTSTNAVSAQPRKAAVGTTPISAVAPAQSTTALILAKVVAALSSFWQWFKFW